MKIKMIAAVLLLSACVGCTSQAEKDKALSDGWKAASDASRLRSDELRVSIECTKLQIKMLKQGDSQKTIDRTLRHHGCEVKP